MYIVLNIVIIMDEIIIFVHLGFKTVLANRSYNGEISFLPSKETENHPRDGTICKARFVMLRI